MNTNDLRVLVVDDDADVMRGTARVLTQAGFATITAASGEEALEILRASHPNLVLLDWDMPGMDGVEVCRRIKAAPELADVLVVLISGSYTESDEQADGMNSGADGFIARPVGNRELVARIEAYGRIWRLNQVLREKNAELETMALKDPLTGLANRRLFAERVEQTIAHARRSKGFMAVLLADLDGFKQVNDSLGHDAGDLLLKEVAERLIAAVRAEDTVARMGGDEFTVSLWALSSVDYARVVAERIIASLSRPFNIKQQAVNISASIGVSVFPDHGTDAESLLKSADLAMYAAKRAGKNTLRFPDVSGHPESIIVNP